MLDLILMMLSSLLTGLRGQAALQAENIALRHQLTVLQRTHQTKRPVLKPGDRCLWFGFHGCAHAGVRHSRLSSLKPSSAGIVKDSVGIGPGRLVTGSPDVL